MLRPSLSSLIRASNSTRSIMTSSLPPLKNVLAKSKSPYLLQHADNPVAWQEWNSETIARAKEEDKPIFLSVGYSACHWCHVLAHESFEDQGIAELMNKYFINVKVDREERPDVDRVYMTYLQATQGSGGWPLSVWLTPTLEPIFAGTYYPKPRFRSILAKIEELWEDDRERCIASGKDVMQQLQDMNSGATRASASLVDVLASKPADKVYTHLVKTHDPRYGGFSPAGGSSKGPKFPSCSLTTTFLARVAVQSGDDERQETARSMAVKMLKSIWTGGIRDWVGGGVARYSVDEKWKVPHFEKMLYDQAQLVTAALDFARITRPFTSQDLDFDQPKTEEDKDYVSLLDLANNILTYSIRDLRSSAGGFFSAEDADSAEARGGKKVEGAFYIWSQQEIEEVVDKDDVDIFKYFFGIKLDGNVDPAHDIQGELVGKNILCREHSEDEAANKFNTDAVTVRQKIERACAALKVFRDEHRERPGLDDKILTSWNGLMISALASAVNVLPSSRYPVAEQVAQVADEVVQFIRTNLYDVESGKLFRSWRDGKGPTAQADDYAFLIQGLLDLYEATGNESYLLFAVDLQAKQDELFFDEAHGGYFASAPDEHIIVRMKDSQDGAEPSATSVSVHNNSRLSLLASTNFAKYEERAEMTWLSIASELKQVPRAFATSVAGLMDLEAGYREFIVIGSRDDPDTEKLLQTIRGEAYIPNKVVIHIDPAKPPRGLAAINETVKDLIDKLSVANSSQGVSLRICEGGVCGMPIEGLEEARKAVLGSDGQD